MRLKICLIQKKTVSLHPDMGACVRGTCETRASAKSYRCFSLCGDIQQAVAYLLVSLTLDFLRFQGVAPQGFSKKD